MQTTYSIPEKTLTAVLDREIYQVIWMNFAGYICMDGDRKVTDMNRESALEAYREGNVLKVFCINLIEGTCRDVTDEIAGEIEYEQEQAEAYEYVSPRVYRSLENAGRTL
ncbi:hypothetical protein ACFOLL_04525 [Falsochrobactrum ovis]|uniref:Uncharacterized protein n=1 Tax=Falsochrobactrum ovis TaxID=1293442 RepID=A0A364JVN7_9HYPH|nr:hypothetical protein [Falsochrobactrum ovis]RAK29118.1 hypothetical protein C7374_105169 [Falsochrobactrum ovis]